MDFSLPIFPPGSLSESVITTVWLGTWVIVFFNQWLGWPLSGLIVPGYLVPLMILKPLSAGVICVEAIVTYGIAWLLYLFLPKLGWWYNIFGRDRFFALVLLSILVRIGFDFILIPWLMDMASQSWRIPFSYRSQMHSFGLIIIALLANQFWKPGLMRGLIPLGVILGITYVLVRYLLLPYTNFTISSIEYLYEDVAGNILAGPKAYIIILTACFISSRMNLLYGWDFSGILIPSLLALMWYQPLKLVITLLETFVILGLAYGVLALPMFKLMTIEGGRKLLLFFNLAFFYKIILGFFLVAVAPDLKVTDFFGFGYLLTTLMAVKMHEKGIAVRMTRAVFQVSLVAALLANVVGYCLTLVPQNSAQAVPVENRKLIETRDYKDVIRNDKLNLYRADVATELREPGSLQITRFVEAFRYLRRVAPDQLDGPMVDRARNLLATMNYSLDVLQDRYLYLHEKDTSSGWGFYVIDTRASTELMLIVPAPLDEWMTMEAALILGQPLGARVIAVNSLSHAKSIATGIDPVGSNQSLISAIFREAGLTQTLYLHGLTSSTALSMASSLTDYDPDREDSLLFVKARIPEGLDLGILGDMVGPYLSYFAEPPGQQFHRQIARYGFADLYLSKKALRRLLSRDIREYINLGQNLREMTGNLQGSLLVEEGRFAGPGSGLYVPPQREELLYMDGEVFEPLIDLAWRYGQEPEIDHQELEIIAAGAAGIGYETLLYQDTDQGRTLVMLRERDDVKRRYWGTYLIQMGPAEPFVVQVPRPVYESQSFNFGLSMFERLNGRALMVSGSHPHANERAVADPLQAGNRDTLFNLVHQSLLRGLKQDHLVLQIRAMSYRTELPYTETPILLSSNRGILPQSDLGPLEKTWLKVLEEEGLSYGFADGRPETVGYGMGGNPQAEFLRHTPNHRILSVWVSKNLRRSFRAENQRIPLQCLSLGIPVETLDPLLLLKDSRSGGPWTDREDLTRYLGNFDILALERLARDPNLRLRLLLDEAAMFLLISNPQGQPLVLVNPEGRQEEQPITRDPAKPLSQQLDRFIHQRFALFQWEAGQ